MSDAIEYLEERDDVEKTEYTRVQQGRMRRVEVEMWHDAEGLHTIFQMALNGTYSEKALMEKAEERALAVRRVECDGLTHLKATNSAETNRNS